MKLPAPVTYFVTTEKNLGHKLSGLCESWWAIGVDGVMQFRTALSNIILALNNISKWQDAYTAFEADTLRTALCKTDTTVSIVYLSDPY